MKKTTQQIIIHYLGGDKKSVIAGEKTQTFLFMTCPAGRSWEKTYNDKILTLKKQCSAHQDKKQRVNLYALSSIEPVDLQACVLLREVRCGLWVLVLHHRLGTRRDLSLKKTVAQILLFLHISKSQIKYSIFRLFIYHWFCHIKRVQEVVSVVLMIIFTYTYTILKSWDNFVCDRTWPPKDFV